MKSVVTMCLALATWSVAAPCSEGHQSFADCYQLTVSSWTPPLDLGSDEKYATPPEFLELGKEAAKWPGAEGSIVRGKSANADEPPLQAYWNEVDGELRIVF